MYIYILLFIFYGYTAECSRGDIFVGDTLLVDTRDDVYDTKLYTSDNDILTDWEYNYNESLNRHEWIKKMAKLSDTGTYKIRLEHGGWIQRNITVLLLKLIISGNDVNYVHTVVVGTDVVIDCKSPIRNKTWNVDIRSTTNDDVSSILLRDIKSSDAKRYTCSVEYEGIEYNETVSLNVVGTVMTKSIGSTNVELECRSRNNVGWIRKLTSSNTTDCMRTTKKFVFNSPLTIDDRGFYTCNPSDVNHMILLLPVPPKKKYVYSACPVNFPNYLIYLYIITITMIYYL